MKVSKLAFSVIFCLIISSLSFVSTREHLDGQQSQQNESNTQVQEKSTEPAKKETPTIHQGKNKGTRLDKDDDLEDIRDKNEQEDNGRQHHDDDDDLALLKDHGAFIGSFLSILITEIGDKTFIVTAVLATKYNKLWVFIGSYGALFLMTLISCFIGNVSLSLINPDYIKYLAAALFFIFGGKAIYEAATNKLEDDDEEIEHDLKELDEKINKKVYGDDYHPQDENKNADQENGINGANQNINEVDNQLETEELQQSLIKQQQKQNKKNMKPDVPNTFIAAQTFLQNFLGEWGDRSQISTIAMSASFDFFQVFLGCALGHAACSYLAITGGKLLAERFSERTLTLAGGILFVIYGIATLFSI